MMTTYSIPEIEERLAQVRDQIVRTVDALSDERLFAGSDQSWSAADYLKHLILAVKPFAKGLALPREQLLQMFERPSAPSRSYEAFAAAYHDLIAAGARAELVPTVMPTGYRMPEGVTDVRAYLLETWQDANARLLKALQGWTEGDLDAYQMPHPAVGMATIREMLYFTLLHNTLHGADIAGKAG
ncbi:MAG: DinB family protein [Anaerolineae bacterium]|nr:DinB family protein [Anaerolineae bacterium]NUQ05059.1 DinB family protein [Anaerolineae bacterium]